MRTAPQNVTGVAPLGEALRRLREQNGLTPFGAARKIAISRSTLERAEVDADSVKHGVLKKIARMYSVRLSDLEAAEEEGDQ